MKDYDLLYIEYAKILYNNNIGNCLNRDDFIIEIDKGRTPKSLAKEWIKDIYEQENILEQIKLQEIEDNKNSFSIKDMQGYNIQEHLIN